MNMNIPSSGTDRYRILLLGARRRIAFARYLRGAGSALGAEVELFGSDTDDLDPLRHFCDGFFLLPRCDDPAYVARLQEHVKRHGIDLIIPWNDQDIACLNELSGRNAWLRERVVLPPPHVARLCLDKRVLAQWGAAQGVRQPRQYALNAPDFPCVVKPVNGQGSVGVVVCRNRVDYDYAIQLNQNKDVLVQEFIDGTEYTIDFFSWPIATLHVAVPRKRIKTRGGEVLIAQVELHADILAFVAALVRKLEFVGMLNCQVMLDRDGAPVLIEFNPRFGGGVDLSIAAGADFPKYMLELARNGRLSSEPPRLRDGVIMTRYHESVFSLPNALAT